MAEQSDSDLKMLTIKEASQLLSVSETLLRQKINLGEISSMMWGTEPRIPLWSLRDWQENNLTPINNSFIPRKEISQPPIVKKMINRSSASVKYIIKNHRRRK